MLPNEAIIQLLREKLLYLRTEYGVERIGLFGSFAKGVPSEASDVDLVVEFRHPIGLKFVELVDYLKSVLGRHVDVLTPGGIQAIRRANVARNINASIIYV